MAQETIMVVEDDENILELITHHLCKADFCVQQIMTGEEALERASWHPPDLILLDLMLPKMGGMEVCKKLKANKVTRTIPIVIVSARGADSDVVAGLEAGADDYITKPFRPAELVSQVQSMLRMGARPQGQPAQDISLSKLQILANTQEVLAAGQPVDLTENEFRTLHYLALHTGRICTRGQIKTALGYTDEVPEGFSLDDQVMQLEKKLGDTGADVETIRRIGYRLKDSGS